MSTSRACLTESLLLICDHSTVCFGLPTHAAAKLCAQATCGHTRTSPALGATSWSCGHGALAAWFRKNSWQTGTSGGGRQRAGCSDGDMPRIVLPWLAFGRVHVVGGGLPTGSRSVFLSKSGLATQNTLAAKSFLALLPLESNEPFGRADASGFTWV